MIRADWKRNASIYLILLPVVLYYALFKYVPMYGIVLAFKDFSSTKGIWHSPWIGFENFTTFFNSYYFWRIIRNTILISLYQLIWGFPAPIILALLLNEVRREWFKRLVQTVTYLPHFISVIVICGILVDFLGRNGLITNIVVALGGERTAYLGLPGYFRTILVSSDIWQEVGWSSIIYLAALSGINPELYDAAKVDGAGRFRQIQHVTLPGIMPIILILLILRIGHLLDIGYEKIILLYNPNTYATGDVISSFVYREGLLSAQYSYTTAVGLFQSLINFVLLVFSNAMSRRFTGNKLW